MNKQKLNYHLRTVNDLNLNTISDQTQSFILKDSQIMKLTTQIDQQNQRINRLIKTIDDSRQEQNKKFNHHFQELFKSNTKQYNQEILKELSGLKQQFLKIEETQPQKATKQKSHYQSHLPPLQSSYFEQQNSEKKDQNLYKQTQEIKNRGMKSSSIDEKEIQDFNQQIQPKKQSHSVHKKSKPNQSKTNYTKTEVSPPSSSKRKIQIMSRQKQRTQKLYNSDNFQQFQDPLMITTKQPFEYDKLTTKSQKKKQFNLKKARYLLRRFKAVSICVWLSLTLFKYCKKIWHENYMIFKDWSQELIGRFDSQFVSFYYVIQRIINLLQISFIKNV
ncbi:unnamed protein product (macronuclear) [Paramecium tetraurelia]|uniref:Transmembrane protein n=1 Tax=Paramecium tetraurelia TaxID=5888 RepID=A0EHF0_PARTE|nr:uncharacterized protein GSPATT00027065001 [Paramecium tetraurelia]CAK94741.1 unnamed protein product [Paramecium tetraurelia]|eukprot:XP_001462114.1 hypothetical protein (macronuclear) [Paramecium tetraurelia strain d4-2]